MPKTKGLGCEIVFALGGMCNFDYFKSLFSDVPIQLFVPKFPSFTFSFVVLIAPLAIFLFCWKNGFLLLHQKKGTKYIGYGYNIDTAKITYYI